MVGHYVSGKFGSRKGVDVGSITLHPPGLPHGPQPGLAEKSIGTHELAVMCDTFYTLKLTKFAKKLEDGRYAYSVEPNQHLPADSRRLSRCRAYAFSLSNGRFRSGARR